jgi:hypothetical protein
VTPETIHEAVLLTAAGTWATEVPKVAQAIAALDPRPRTHRWRSLTYCIVDAVWSIGAQYDQVVAPLTRAVADSFGDQQPLTAHDDPEASDPVPLETFLDRFPTADDLIPATNRQRVFSRSAAPYKAEGALAHARVLLAHDVRDLHDARRLMGDAAAFDGFNAQLRRLAGEGGHGIRRGYLWMLIGDDQMVKPDRMVLRWLAGLGIIVTPDVAAALITLAARELTSSGQPTTPWGADHAIWNAQRASTQRHRNHR